MILGTAQTPKEGRAVATRERLLDAAEVCFGRSGLDRVTLDDIATAAKVHRATLHRTFPGGRDELVMALLSRESRRLIERVLAVIDESTGVEQSIVEAITAIVSEVRAAAGLQPLLAASATRSAVFGPAAADLRSSAAAVWEHVAALARAQGVVLVDASAAQVVDHLFRIGISLVADPGELAGADAVRAYVRTFVVPSLITSTSARAQGQRP